MNKIYKTRLFNKWQKKESITDQDLANAITEMANSLVDATLGANLYKKRIAKQGHGKRSGYRTIVATRHHGIWFFIIGFAKNEKDNINQTELKAIQRYAKLLLDYNNIEISKAISEQNIIEVNYETK